MNHPTTLVAALRQGESIPIAGALFDMDGTLVDSIPAVEDAWSIWTTEYGIPTPGSTMHGKTARAVVLASGLPVDAHEHAERRLAEIEARPGQQLRSLPGARFLVDSLPHGRWGIVTSATRSVASARLAATDLPMPEFRITGDDVTHGKPAAEPFLGGIRRLADRGFEGTVVAFEDTVAGATSASEAGCIVIGVLGTEPRTQLERCAHIVLDSLEAVRVTDSDGTLHVRLV
ncbi:HAD hydrolase-like protein [Microbacterium sp. A82]|uniref:HAD hydrolase-like protein n=1 Tax=Microbacterium sp. A82 TaxID=3450452 RepID=UPI003F2B6A64